MSWIKFSDRWYGRDEIEKLPSAAAMLYQSMLAWSSEQMTDGHIPRRVLRRKLWHCDGDQDAMVAVLVRGGFCEETDDGWFLPAWEAHNISAEEQKKLQGQAAERQARHRRHVRGDHSTCDPRYCRGAAGSRVTNGVSNAVTNGVSNGTPVPPRPDPTGSRTGKTGAAAAGAAPPQIPHHPFQGTDPYCGQCELPRQHPAHQEQP